MRTRWPRLFVLLAVVIAWPAATQDGAALDIYFVDVEGGAATLMIAPSGEAMLVDTGHPGTVDAERIAADAACQTCRAALPTAGSGSLTCLCTVVVRTACSSKSPSYV